MRWCKYSALGEILTIGNGPETTTEDDIAHIYGTPILNIPDGVDFRTHYYLAGVFLEFGPSPSDHHAWDWTTHSWQVKSTALDDSKAKQSEAINAACRDAIYAGFDSAALGAMHHYPAKAQDQSNLVASVTASLLPINPPDWSTPFWCEIAGAWDYIPHSAAQIQQAGADGKAAILAALGRNEYLQRQIQAATSISEAEAVVW